MPSNPVNTRKCAACREHADKDELIRICMNSEGEISVDTSKCAGGRGVWVHRNKSCVDALVKKKGLHAAFRRQVDESVYQRLYDEL